MIAGIVPLHVILLKLRRHVVDLLNGLGSDAGIGPVETVILRLLLAGPRHNDSLRALAVLDMATFGKVIRRLEGLHLVESESAPSDRRRKLYRLTPSGRAFAGRADEASLKSRELFLEPLSARDQKLLMRLLSTISLSHEVIGSVRQDAQIVEILGEGLDPGTLLRRVLQISTQCADAELSPHGVTPLEAALLQVVAHFGSVAAKDLPRILGIDRASAFVMLRKLESAGFLARGDAQSRLLSLAPQGQDLAGRVALAITAAEDHMTAALNLADRGRFARVLQRLHARLAEPRPSA